jgi:RNA polymerase sigma factor (sigma-70 family)
MPMPENIPDEQLVQDYLAGKIEAFFQLVNRYQARLIIFAFHILNQRQDAEDAVQETWIRIWETIKEFEPTRKFSSWLYHICKGKCYDELRRRHLKFDKLPKNLDTIKSTSLREMALNKESRTWCLAVLNHRQRLLYDAIMVKGMNYEQVLYEVKELCPVEKGCVLEVKPEYIEKLRNEFAEIMEIVYNRSRERMRRDWEKIREEEPVGSATNIIEAEKESPDEN